MDLYAYSQIEDLNEVLEVNNIKISRLRGIRLMKNEEKVSQEEIESLVNEQKLDNAITWLQQKCWDCWDSSKADKKRKCFVYKTVPSEYREGEFEEKIIAIKWNKVRRKDRNRIKLENRADEKRIRTNLEMFNSYVGKDVLYVHARQGGGNRDYYPIDTKHPMYLSDCDDYFDSTYCDIYYDLTKGKEEKKND